MASTPKQEVGGPADEPDEASLPGARPEQLIQTAEEILGYYLKPGQWPGARKVERFRQSGGLERVLALYARAMEMEPQDPAHPWNLASSLDRLRLHDMALIYMARAIRVAEETDDGEWAGAHAHLGWADIAIKASEPALAAVAIEKARTVDPDVPVERYERRLRERYPPTAIARTERNQDSARKGAAVEHLIAASSMLASSFELSVSTNLVDDEGVDLVFHRRGGTATLGVQVKSRSRSVVESSRHHRFLAEVRDATFKARPNLYLLFATVDMRFGDYGPVWFIPSEDFAAEVQPNSRRKRRFVASASPTSRDRWSRYKLERSELPRQILDVLDVLEQPSATDALAAS